MSDKEHCGLKLLVDAAKKTTQFCTQLWIGIGKRLVQQQYGRILNKRPGDGDSLPEPYVCCGEEKQYSHTQSGGGKALPPD